MKTKTKVLVDNLGRIVGRVAPRTGRVGWVIEYGGVRDGVLDVKGIARIAWGRPDAYDLKYYPVYDGTTGRRIT